ncbi:MAG: DUF4364 family protein [Oscillospiraceae bacterium]|jgi:hypothetical protein|nr:DUF4364 family protein [Oscillospiraceae bacterium]
MAGNLTDFTDIKILLLHIIASSALGAREDACCEAAESAGGVSYFDGKTVLGELVAAGLVEKKDGKLIVAPSGLVAENEMFRSLPFSVQQRADEAAQSLARLAARESSISIEKTPQESGRVFVLMTISDGGEIVNSVGLSVSENRADAVGEVLRRQAETLRDALATRIYDGL